MPSHIGKHIGKYEVRRLIGLGGFGSVYEAYDPAVGRRVALKVIESGDADVLARFRREASAAGNLRHKNIVTIYELGVDQDLTFIAMEYLEGDNLQRTIDGSHPLDLLEKVQIMREVAEGLEYAHGQGVVHRDIKPANIMILRDQSVKIMDFGIAMRRDQNTRLTQAGFLLGTVSYMSPEQFTGTNSGPLTDIYAYGVTYYELLSGKAPFVAENYSVLIYKIIEALPEPLHALVPDCPPALEALISRALAKSPEARYQSMKEVVLDSESFLGQLRTRRSAELLVKAREALSRNEYGLAQDDLLRAFTLDPGNKEAQALLESLRRKRDAEEPARAREPAPADLQAPPHNPDTMSLDQASSPGVFTQMFQASLPPPSPPASNPPPPGEFTRLMRAQGALAPAPFAPPPPPAATAEPGEFTRMFQTGPPSQQPRPSDPSAGSTDAATGIFLVPPSQPDKARPPSVDEDLATRTVLTISNCGDTAFLNSQKALDHFPFIVGRGGDWDLPFDLAISARHVEIDYSDGGFFIRDLGSSNGTFLNGRRLQSSQREVLLFGARILLGSNTELIFGSGAPREIPDLLGALVGGRFRLVEKLHTSSKSVLYRARDENLPRHVVVKLLSPTLGRYSGYRQQFTREAQTAASLRHPRICQVLDYGELALNDPPKSCMLYVCMEYLTGGSFQSRLSRPDPFPLAQVASWLDAMCDVLAYIHEQKVIHSGIKPTAIVFDERENPHLTDFAFAAGPAEGVRQTIMGWPAFLAPEQWDGLEPVPATDQYSLAVLFYWLIAGAPPFEGQEHLVVRKRNLLLGPAPLHEIAAKNRRPPLPGRISPVLQKALAERPADRYTGTRDFAAAFRTALLEPASVRSRPASVFISYQRAESSLLANMIKKEMERESGFDVFVDAIQQDASGQFPYKLQSRIEQSDIFICLLGGSTLRSDWVMREIRIAAKSAKPMIPVFQENYRPRKGQALDAHVQELLAFEGVKILDRQNLFVDAALQKLIALARRSIEHPEPPAGAPLPQDPPGNSFQTRLVALIRRIVRVFVSIR